jgi:hypothetical protein
MGLERPETFAMTLARTATSSRAFTDGTIRRGFGRVIGEFAAVFEAAIEIFAEAGDRSAAAREGRFPPAA